MALKRPTRVICPLRSDDDAEVVDSSERNPIVTASGLYIRVRHAHAIFVRPSLLFRCTISVRITRLIDTCAVANGEKHAARCAASSCRQHGSVVDVLPRPQGCRLSSLR